MWSLSIHDFFHLIFYRNEQIKLWMKKNMTKKWVSFTNNRDE